VEPQVFILASDCSGSNKLTWFALELITEQLRKNKLNHLNAACEESGAEVIVSGNIGCITHLQQEDTPVVHWIEIVDQLLSKSSKAS